MFKLPELSYSYDSLEPYIDVQTMDIHLNKHHQTYIDNLNNALLGFPDWQNKDLEYLLLNLSLIPESIRTAVKNNAGGHYNHSLFWLMMKKNGAVLSGQLLKDIEKKFISFDLFKKSFEDSAKSLLGSGWVWLVFSNSNGLEIVKSSNQDCPILKNIYPILVLDVWEHAYYLKYQNRRIDYIKAWWNVVNWDYAQDRYLQAIKNN